MPSQHPKSWDPDAIEGAKQGPATEAGNQLAAGLTKRFAAKQDGSSSSVCFTPSMLRGLVDNGGELMDRLARCAHDFAQQFDRFEYESPSRHSKGMDFYTGGMHGLAWEHILSPNNQLARWADSKWVLNFKPMATRLRGGLPQLPVGAELWVIVPAPGRMGSYWEMVEVIAHAIRDNGPEGTNPSLKTTHPYGRFTQVLDDLLSASKKSLGEIAALWRPTSGSLLELYARNSYGDFVLIPVQMGKAWDSASARHMSANLRGGAAPEFPLDPLTALSLIWAQPELFTSHWQNVSISFPGATVRTASSGEETILSLVTNYRVDHTRLELKRLDWRGGGHATGFKAFV